MANKKEIKINKDLCVACGNCVKHCPTKAISIRDGIHAEIDKDTCVSCGKCKIACPASVISVDGNNRGKKVLWRNQFWLFTILYLSIGFFNIIFAWLGLLCFFIPILISIFAKNKSYCNNYCGRGQLLDLLGDRLHLSSMRDIPEFLKTKLFRYGFLLFFFGMFFNMLYSTYLVFINVKEVKQVVTLFWTFKLPWDFAYVEYNIPEWMHQFTFGFYSIMITSTILGFIFMILYKPKSWCVICPMGTTTQLICKASKRKNK